MNPRDGEAIADFSRKYVVSPEVCEGLVDHLDQIEMRRSESERQQTKRLEQEYGLTSIRSSAGFLLISLTMIMTLMGESLDSIFYLLKTAF